MSTLNLVYDLNEQKPVDFANYGFEFAYKMRKNLDPSIGYFTFSHIYLYYEKQEDGTIARKKILKPIETELCNI